MAEMIWAPAPRERTEHGAAWTCRRLAVAALSAAGGTVLVWQGAGHLLHRGLGAHIDEVLGTAVLWLGLAVAAWYVLTAGLGALCLLGRLGGAGWQRAERVLDRAGAPLLRRLLSAGAGAALVSSTLLSPALASAPESEESVPVDLTWGHASQPRDSAEELASTPPAGQEPVPGAEPTAEHTPTETATAGQMPSQDPNQGDSGSAAEDGGTPAPSGEQHGTAPEDDPGPPSSAGEQTSATPDGADTSADAAETPPAGDPPDQPQAEGPASYRVATGDSLWQIAAAHLPADATAAEVAQHWPRWYRANESTIGPDPDLLLPGQRLQPPERSTR